MDYCEHQLDSIDALVVILGTPGLTPMFDMYRTLDAKIRTCKKPVFPVLASPYTAAAEVKEFLDKGNVLFTDETLLGNALTRVVNTPLPSVEEDNSPLVDVSAVRSIMDSIIQKEGYISVNEAHRLLSAVGIPMVDEYASAVKKDVLSFARRCGFPVVAKAVGPVHKSDVGGVSLDIQDEASLSIEFDRLMTIDGATAVLVQPMVQGMEFFVGAKNEKEFGSMLLCGLGGIYVEVLQDIATGLAPLSHEEALSMIRSLRSYKIIQGVRGGRGIDENGLADILVRLSVLLENTPEIQEMDINPLVCSAEEVRAVDVRIRVGK